MNIIKYRVTFGPDNSHLWDYNWFYKIKKARQFIVNMGDTPLGLKRPYNLKRWKYKKPRVYGGSASSKLIGKRRN